MRKIVKGLGVFVGLVALIGLTAFAFLNEKRPVAPPSAQADSLAKKMLLAVNKSAWDSTHIITWKYGNGHTYIWDKKNNFVFVNWGDYRVLLNLQTWDKGRAFKGTEEVKGPDLDVVRGKAWAYFCNDSFWLIAPFKVFDEGTTRSLVPNEDGTNDLLVSYASGGVTPGDAYLWKLDASGLPLSYKMWVKVLPVGGVMATWEGWSKQPSGVMLPSFHQLGPLKLPIKDLRTGHSLTETGVSGSIFDPIR